MIDKLWIFQQQSTKQNPLCHKPELNATPLLFAEPTMMEEQLDQRVFELLWSTISDDVKRSLDLPVKNLFRLWEQLENKYVPRVDCNQFMGIHFLRSVAYKQTQGINEYTAQFAQQVQMINRTRTLIPDELAILMFIDSFSKLPKLKSVLLDYLEDHRRNNRFISLKHMLNYANLHFPAQCPAKIQLDQKDDELSSEFSSSDGFYDNFNDFNDGAYFRNGRPAARSYDRFRNYASYTPYSRSSFMSHSFDYWASVSGSNCVLDY